MCRLTNAHTVPWANESRDVPGVELLLLFEDNFRRHSFLDDTHRRLGRTHLATSGGNFVARWRLDLIDRRLSHYHITAAIGAGGMGEVYRATDTKLGREVALKVLPAGMERDPARLARFQREARAIAALNDPHIVTIFSVGEAEGVHFLTMELVEGQALGQLIPVGGMRVARL